MTTTRPPPDRPGLGPVLGLFLLSGAMGLVFEVLWSQRLGHVFGHAAYATAATLLAFFLGLALGAGVWGRWASGLRRPLLVYGLLEIGVAVTAGAAFLLDGAHHALYAHVVHAAGHDVVALAAGRLLLAVLLLGPAAFLMGGTLPVLGTHVVRRVDTLGRRASLLYAVNTLGAAGGALLAGFALPPWLGYRGAYLVAMAAAALVGCLALLLARHEGPQGAVRPGPAGAPEAARPLPWGRACALAFASGFLALALQVAWTRLFARVLQNSVQVFATILAVYLLALGLAGGLAHLLARTRVRRRPTLALLLASAGVLVAASGALYLAATGGTEYDESAGWVAYVFGVAWLILLVVGPPVLVLGTVFPYLWRMAEGTARATGRILGTLAGWNTLGAALGAVAAGFVLLPTGGTWLTLRSCAVLYALLGIALALKARSWVAKALAGAALVATAAAFWPLPTPARPRTGEVLLDAWEGPSGTVAVFRRDEVKKLRFNDVFTLGGSEDMRWERLQTHVALGLHPAPRSVFYLGMGTGITAGAAMVHDLDRVVVAEIVPEVVEAARRHFAEHVDGLFEAPHARIVVDDGRHALTFGHETYDVVVGDLFFPWEVGAADLFTREHFEAVRARLAPGGVFVQWLPGYQLSERQFLGIAKTMLAVFPLVTVWRGDFVTKRPILAVAGHARFEALDGDRLVSLARSLEGRDDTGLADHPVSLPFFFYAGNLTEAEAVVGSVPLHTQDRPWIAWEAPRELRRRAAGEAMPFTGDRVLAFEEALARAMPPAKDPYLARLDGNQKRRVAAGLALRQMAVHQRAMRASAHRRAVRRWVLLVPENERPPLDDWID